VLRVPALTHLLLDDRGLPTGETEPAPAHDGPMGETTYDDLYEAPPDLAVAVADGTREVTVRFLEGYTHLQLFAPPGQELIAIEPMTAPTDALRTGDGLRLATEPFRAAFAVEVRALDR
jgi:galactose mutarotase-like enzyme